MSVSEPVAIVSCTDYQEEAVMEAVDRTMHLLGGMQQFVQPGQKVLLKVNLLSASAPEKAITTHPAVVEAVTRAVQAAGGRPMIGDSPGASVRWTESGLRSVYRSTGMEDVARRTGAALMLDTRAEEVSFPEGKLLKRIEVIGTALDADVIINLPKFKNHILTTFTGATKNMFGIIPGAKKALLHVTPRTLTNFNEVLLDVLRWSQPVLSIMDGVIGMEGDGPSGGRPKQVGVLLASTNALALDVIATQIAGLSADRVTILKQAAARGWWSGDVKSIPTLGMSLEEARLTDFVPASPNRHPESGTRLPLVDRYIAPTLVNWLAVKPVPAAGRCTACRACVRACPREAIEIRDNLATVDYGRCIRCYCCHEMCPENAIDLEQPALARLLRL
jgi:uncharacterized protein (DUF362 family)/ferredoxin